MGGEAVILLDTHAWIWHVTESPNLSRAASKAVAKADDLAVSIISCWEVAMLVAKQRIGFSIDVQDWIDAALQQPKVRLLPIDPKVAVLATRLPGEFHADPVDPFLAATCLTYGIPIITKDRRIRDWGQIRVIW
ncbi:MAG: type II toxin-antitoxin system VapC family toxin [Candidatus Latescibacteria bacterium]|jgi:PIN domain nuclease of toxin-antitoxin system|nr:type II toxin-antitoxin system VapC family toxin [Candidatus Latescibacterota bacterium]